MYFPYAVLRPYSSNGTNAARIEKYTGDGQEAGHKDTCKPHDEGEKKPTTVWIVFGMWPTAISVKFPRILGLEKWSKMKETSQQRLGIWCINCGGNSILTARNGRTRHPRTCLPVDSFRRSLAVFLRAPSFKISGCSSTMFRRFSMPKGVISIS